MKTNINFLITTMSIPLPPTKININHNKPNQNQIFINNPLINNKTHHKNPQKNSNLKISKTKMKETYLRANFR